MSLYGGMDYAGDPAGLARSGDAACYARSWTGPAPDAPFHDCRNCWNLTMGAGTASSCPRGIPMVIVPTGRYARCTGTPPPPPGSRQQPPRRTTMAVSEELRLCCGRIRRNMRAARRLAKRMEGRWSREHTELLHETAGEILGAAQLVERGLAARGSI